MQYTLHVLLLTAIGGAVCQQFSCRGRLAGGYYGDVATQCRDFHVCVRAGGAVTAFRFNCPEGTAFHQQAQTCAEWAELGCPDSSLGEAFDIYRLGSGFETKKAVRPPIEEESEFPLQRADSDLRGEHSSDFFSGSRREYYNRRSTVSAPIASSTVAPTPPPTQAFQRSYQKRKLVRKQQRRPIEQSTAQQPAQQPPQQPAQQPTQQPSQLTYFNSQAYRSSPAVQAPQSPRVLASLQNGRPEQTLEVPKRESYDTFKVSTTSVPSKLFKNSYASPDPRVSSPSQSGRLEQPLEVPRRDPYDSFKVSTTPAPPKFFKNSYAPSDTFRISPGAFSSPVPYSSPTSTAPELSSIAVSFNKRPKSESYNSPRPSYDKPLLASFRVATTSASSSSILPSTHRSSTPAYRPFSYSSTVASSTPASPTPIVSDYSAQGSSGKTGTPKKYYSSTPQYDGGKDRNSIDKSNKYDFNGASSSAPLRRDYEPVSFSRINDLQSTPSFLQNDITQEEDDGQWRPSPHEDDGQWRPDIYDKDDRQDELLTAAHSINIAASKNRLHQDSRPKPFSAKPSAQSEAPKKLIKEEPRGFSQTPIKTVTAIVSQPSHFSQSPAPLRPTTYSPIPPPAFVSRPPAPAVQPNPTPKASSPAPILAESRPVSTKDHPKKQSAPLQKKLTYVNEKDTKANKPQNVKDASYDYAYYDSSDPFTEYDHIEDFGKTNVKNS